MATSDKEIDNVPDTNVQPKDTYGYAKMGVGELRKTVIDLVKSNQAVLEAKQDYVSAANDTMKETKNKITAALEFLALAERAGTDLAHENNVVAFLNSKASQA